MKMGRRVLLSGLVLVLIFITAVYAIRQSFKAEPLVGQVNNVLSQDNQWIATLEEVDNGLGFGQGILYDEIHIRRPGEVITDHGDDERTVIFYADSMGQQAAERPKIKWIDSSHLLIIYSPARIEGRMPGKAIEKYDGIQVSYTHVQ